MESSAATPVESAAAAAVDAVTAMTNRLTVDADNGRPLELDGAGGNVYSCKGCRTHLARADDVISKSFHCYNGRAYLFDKVVNVTAGVKEDRMLMTGLHTVSDIFCVGCGSIVGWKYEAANEFYDPLLQEAAHEKSQRYKEGKYILDRYLISVAGA